MMGTDLDWQLGDQQTHLHGDWSSRKIFPVELPIDLSQSRTGHQLASLGCTHFSTELAPLVSGINSKVERPKIGPEKCQAKFGQVY